MSARYKDMAEKIKQKLEVFYDKYTFNQDRPMVSGKKNTKNVLWFRTNKQ